MSTKKAKGAEKSAPKKQNGVPSDVGTVGSAEMVLGPQEVADLRALGVNLPDQRVAAVNRAGDINADPQLKNEIVYAAFLDELKTQRSIIEAGDGRELIEALKTFCLAAGSMPEWLRLFLYGRLEAYTTHRVATLDEAFNVSRPKRYRLKAAHAKEKISFELWFSIEQLRALGLSDEGLVEDVSELFGIKKSLGYEYLAYQKRLRGQGDERFFEDGQLPLTGLPAGLEAIYASRTLGRKGPGEK